MSNDILGKLSADQLRAIVETEFRKAAERRGETWKPRDQTAFRDYIVPSMVLPTTRTISAVSNKRRLTRPPGYAVSHILEFVYSRKTYERVFQPHIIDMREEHAAALAAGRHKKAVWSVVRDHLYLVAMMGMHIPHWLITVATKFWPKVPL